MYSWSRVSSKNFLGFTNLNKNISSFNPFNYDFLDFYYNCNFIVKLWLKRKLYLIKFEDSPIGFLWIKRNRIMALYFESEHLSEGFNYALKNLIRGRYIYESTRNPLIVDSFIKNGAKIDSDTYLMKKDSSSLSISFDDFEDIKFVKYKEGRDEKRRLEVQNKIFFNSLRTPINISHIYSEYNKDYYLEDGCVFLMFKKKIIGYGQIIKKENAAMIVNFGIIEEYRGRGLGKIFIMYLENLSAELGYSKLSLEVSKDNETALNLYKRVGFNIESEKILWNVYS